MLSDGEENKGDHVVNMENLDKDAKSHDPESHDQSSPPSKTRLQDSAGDGGHGNPAMNDQLQQNSPSPSSEEISNSAPNSEETVKNNAEEHGSDGGVSPATGSPQKGDDCVVSMETEDNRNHGNNKSPSSSGKVHVVSAEITPEPRQSPTASNSSNHSNKDVDVCVVTKEGVSKQDEIKYIDESPTGDSSGSGKTSPVTNDNKDICTDPENRLKELEQKDKMGNSPKDKEKSVTKETKKSTTNGKHKGEENKERDFNVKSSPHGTEKGSPSETDKLLNGNVMTRDVVVEDMSNIDEKMPITKL